MHFKLKINALYIYISENLKPTGDVVLDDWLNARSQKFQKISY